MDLRSITRRPRVALSGYYARKRELEQRQDILADPIFMEFLARCQPYTMTSVERLFALYQLCDHVLKAEVAGDFVECGVWKGGSAMMMALVMLRYPPDQRRTLHLFDTYSGMPEPGSADGTQAKEEWGSQQRDDYNEWCYASEQEVLKNIASTGWPTELTRSTMGRVEETIPNEAPDAIGVLRLDTDWYESTKHELLHLYPRVVPGGGLIIDDYGHWMGARRAVDEYFEGSPTLLQRIDYTGRLAIRQG